LNEKTLRDLVIETSRDVKWIRASLDELKEKETFLEKRLRTLEECLGNTQKSHLYESQLSAGAGAGAGGIVAIILRLFGG